MATKAKTDTAPKSTPAPAQAPQSAFAASYAKAVKLFESGKHAEAVKAFESLLQETQAAGDWAVKRRVQVFLAIAEAKLHPAKAAAADPASEIQACLNRRQTDEALKLAEKAVKAHPASGSLHYLRAVAFAQAENTEASAESLKKAVELDGDLVFQWHMEPDFNPIRKSPLFAFTEGR
ncbi:MAG TPA: tetratricopeptide repeat protein [Geothrix sp.]|nr:tetratricopeptide repeat protein [Geothrix sp.]